MAKKRNQDYYWETTVGVCAAAALLGGMWWGLATLALPVVVLNKISKG